MSSMNFLTSFHKKEGGVSTTTTSLNEPMNNHSSSPPPPPLYDDVINDDLVASNHGNDNNVEEENSNKKWYFCCKKPTTNTSSSSEQEHLRAQQDFGQKWTTFTKKYCYPILILTVLGLWPFGIYSLHKFTSSTDSTFLPSDDTPSGKAALVYRSAYVEHYDAKNEKKNDMPIGDPLNPSVVVVLDAIQHDRMSLIDGHSKMYRAAKTFALRFESYLLTQPPFDSQSQQTTPLVKVESYYSFLNQSLPILALSFVADRGQTTILMITYRIPAEDASTSKKSIAYINKVIQAIRRYGDVESVKSLSTSSSLPLLRLSSSSSETQNNNNNNKHKYFKVLYTGLKLFEEDMREAINTDLKRIHIYVTPISLGILILVLGCNFYVSIVPIVCVATTVFLWSIVMFVVVSYCMQIPQATPTAMMTLTVGLGIDYTLFLLSRYLSFEGVVMEEMEEGGRRKEEEEALLVVGQGQEEEEEEAGSVPQDANVTTSLQASDMSTPLLNSSANDDNNEEQQQNQPSNNSSSDDITDKDNQKAIQTMIISAGHTILISGITLICCFLGLLLLPFNFFQSMAVGCSVTIASTLIVNLTLVPAMLHTKLGIKMRSWAMKRQKEGKNVSVCGSIGTMWMVMKVVLGKCEDWCHCCFYRRIKESGLDVTLDTGNETEEEEEEEEERDGNEQIPNEMESLLPISTSSQLLNGDDTSALTPNTGEERTTTSTNNDNDDDTQSTTSSNNNPTTSTTRTAETTFWHKLAKHLLNPLHAAVILVIILGVTVPIACYSGQITSSINFELAMPQSTSKALETYHFLGKKFGFGSLSPYRVLIDGRDAITNGTTKGKRVDTEEAFNVMHKVIHAFLSDERKRHNNASYETTCDDIDTTHSSNLTILPNSSDIAAFQESVTEMMALVQSHQEATTASSSVALATTTWDGNNLEVGNSFRQQWEPFLQNLVAMETNKTKNDNDDNDAQVLKDNFIKDRGHPSQYNSSSGSSSTSPPSATKYSGIAFVDNFPIPFLWYELAMLCRDIARKDHYNDCPLPILHTLSFINKRITTKDHMTTYISAVLPKEPMAAEGIEWLLSSRKILKCLEAKNELKGYSVYIDGNIGITVDILQRIHDAYPRMITVTLVVVFVLMGLFFRSVVTPIRSVAGIALTTSFVFGLAVLVFQDGDADWMGISTIHNTGEISFIAPITAFSIIVGLGLDYDVFLISRILEFRLEGHTHESSVTEGIAATGGIITAAGVIMAFAFGSLLFSDTPALVQWSFLLTTAVLMDTFVIRTLIVPILMGYTGKYSWWPRKLPEPNVHEVHENDNIVNDSINEEDELQLS